jgi:ribonuclease HI
MSKKAIELTIYTDGSCSPNPGAGGWGFIAVFPEHDIQGSGQDPKTTNNIMEMSAVIEALKEFPQFSKFHIYSDSMYVINCAQGIWKRKKNLDLWKEYDKLAKNKTIRFTWVKAHNGDHYNELVDKLAKNQI